MARADDTDPPAAFAGAPHRGDDVLLRAGCLPLSRRAAFGPRPVDEPAGPVARCGQRPVAAHAWTLTSALRLGLKEHASGHVEDMEQMPSPDRAERNQARKRAFIPVWPIVAAGAVMLAMALFLR